MRRCVLLLVGVIAFLAGCRSGPTEADVAYAVQAAQRDVAYAVVRSSVASGPILTFREPNDSQPASRELHVLVYRNQEEFDTAVVPMWETDGLPGGSLSRGGIGCGETTTVINRISVSMLEAGAVLGVSQSILSKDIGDEFEVTLPMLWSARRGQYADEHWTVTWELRAIEAASDRQ